MRRPRANGKGKICSRQQLQDFPRPSASANGNRNAVETIEFFFEVHGRARTDAALAAASHSALCSVRPLFSRHERLPRMDWIEILTEGERQLGDMVNFMVVRYYNINIYYINHTVDDSCVTPI